ncbi:hypothetical protein K9692_004474 [Escherichia coli]|jgi:hypothetical protein|nr:hypothetical protein [Escherichia coli]
MKSSILSTILLVAVSTQPVFAGNCINGACAADLTAVRSATTVNATVKSHELDEVSKNASAGKSMDALLGQMDSFLNNDKIRINTDSTHKGPGSSTDKPYDELAPIRRYKAIRPELVLSPVLQPVISFRERSV